MKLKINKIRPIKHTKDGEISIELYIGNENIDFVIVKDYSLSLNVFSQAQIKLTKNYKNIEDVKKSVSFYLDNTLKSSDCFYNNDKDLCPFCGSFLFNNNGSKHCLNMNCIDPSEYLRFCYEILSKIMKNYSNKEFEIFAKKLRETCLVFNKIEFNIRNLLNSMSSDITLGSVDLPTKNFYIKFNNAVKNLNAYDFLNLCGIPINYNESIEMFCVAINNNMNNLAQIMRANSVNLSFYPDNDLNEYLRIISILNKDTIEILKDNHISNDDLVIDFF